MDVAAVAALGTVAVGIIGAGVAVRRLPSQERAENANVQHTILADMKLLNDTLIAELARLNVRIVELLAAIAVGDRREAVLERELEACKRRRSVLEAEVARRGL